MANDTIQYRRYNDCICSYLASGLTGVLRYRFEMVGKTRVFYPYVLDEQFDRFNKGQGIVPTERCKDKSSRAYADWDKFLLCFHPEGKVDIMCDYLVFIADGKAGYIPLSGEIQTTKPINTLKDKSGSFIDIQTTLLKDLSYASNEFNGYSVYYRNKFAKGAFTIYKQPVPFEVLYPILKSGTFTKEALFLAYTLNVASTFKAEEVSNYLDMNRKRFINGVSKHWKQDGATDILSKEWCFHTRLLFEQIGKQKLSKKQSHLVEMVLGYCNKRLSKTDLISKRGGIPHFVSLRLNETQVKNLYAALIADKSIRPETKEAEFLYYMLGTGTEIPAKKIIWYDTNTRLSFLVREIAEDEKPPEWRNAARIFESAANGEISDKVLKNAYQQALNQSKQSDRHIKYYHDLVENL